MGDWCLIESDPGVFSELVDKVGVKGVIFDEVYDLDSLASENKADEIYGLVFLFKCNDAPDDPQQKAGRIPLNPPASLFFAKQVIHNACATQAILSILLNASEKVKLPKELVEFKSFTASFDPETRGLAISNQDTIRQVHNSFARQSSFDFDKEGGDKEDSFHFVAYLPHKGKVYELDGLMNGPMLIGDIAEGKSWLDVVKPEIQGRMARYQTASAKSEIRFNLLSVKQDADAATMQEIMKLKFLKQRLAIKLVSLDEEADLGEEELDDDDAPDGVLSFDELPDDVAKLKKMLEEDCIAKVKSLEASIKPGLDRREKWKKENLRRRHDYVPFILCCLEQLAKQGALLPAYAEAKTAAEAAKAAAAATKEEVKA